MFKIIKKDISRKKLASPFDKSTLHQRLISKEAIDLRNNRRDIDFGNGYSRSVPIDFTKKIK